MEKVSVETQWQVRKSEIDEVCIHYAVKATAPTTAMPRQSQLMSEDRTLSIPES